MNNSAHIETNKQAISDTEDVLNRLKNASGQSARPIDPHLHRISRSRSLAITKLEEAIHRLRDDNDEMQPHGATLQPQEPTDVTA